MLLQGRSVKRPAPQRPPPVPGTPGGAAAGGAGVPPVPPSPCMEPLSPGAYMAAALSGGAAWAEQLPTPTKGGWGATPTRAPPPWEGGGGGAREEGPAGGAGSRSGTPPSSAQGLGSSQAWAGASGRGTGGPGHPPTLSAQGDRGGSDGPAAAVGGQAPHHVLVFKQGRKRSGRDLSPLKQRAMQLRLGIGRSSGGWAAGLMGGWPRCGGVGGRAARGVGCVCAGL